jgi:AraC-like DNA-binding protein
MSPDLRQLRASFQGLPEEANPYSLLQNILVYYLDLPCFLVEAGDWKTWHALVNLRSKKTPLDFEDFHQWEDRIRYNERALDKASRSGRALCPPQQGNYGLFVPVMRAGRCHGVLVCGPFLRAVPSQASVLRQWKAISGRMPKPQDPEFSEWVRALADTPVLGSPALRGLQELLEVFAAFLTRSLPGGEAARRMASLQVKVFARTHWHHQWVEWQAIHRRLFRFNGNPKALMPWEKEELGIQRFPTTVLATKRASTGREWSDWLGAMGFHAHARRLAQQMGETIAYPLSNYGTLLLTSAAPGLSAAANRAEMGRRAAHFQHSLAQRFKCPVWVGVGMTSQTGYDLQDSYHEAVAALHMAVSTNQPVLFHSDLPQPAGSDTELRHKVAQLAQAVRAAGGPEALRERDTFIQQVVLGTQGRPEATRRVFLEAFHRLLEMLESAKVLEPSALSEFEASLTLQMESALNINEMVGRFGSGLAALLGYLSKPAEGEKSVRISRACSAIAASLEQTWTLPQAARQFGFSTTAFSREFSRCAGMPFSDFLLAQRLEKAKRMLMEGSSPAALISEACGFKSSNYFAQIFKKKVGVPPGKFRQSRGTRSEQVKRARLA